MPEPRDGSGVTTGSSPFQPPLPSSRGASSPRSRPLPPPYPCNGNAGLAPPRRAGGTATPPAAAVPLQPLREPEAPASAPHLHGPLSDNGDPDAARERWGGGGWGAEPAELGAGRAGRGGPGRAPPRARKSRPRALGKCGRGACALQPAPAPRRSGRTSERAGRRLRRERLGSAAGECARAAPRTAALPLRPGARGLCGAGASVTGAQIRAPRTPAEGSTWTLGRGGTGCSPRAWGRGRCKRVPLFLQLKAWGSDCSKWGGGAGRTQVSASPVPPSAWWGGAEAGHPYCPRPHPAGSGSQSSPPVGGEALRPRPELIGGSWRQPRSRTRRRTSCRLT